MPALEVDLIRALRDFSEMYDYPPSESVVVESIANSLDEKATRLDLSLDKERCTYSLRDNGDGMSNEQFKNYHTLALSSKQKGEGIGFAGVGSKIYLARSHDVEIRTHTYGKDGPLASRIYIRNGRVEWEKIRPNISSRGTLYEVLLTKKDYNDLAKNLEEYVKKWYNTILLGYYGNTLITFNGEPIKPWRPSGKKTDGKFESKSYEFKYKFWICNEDLPEYKQGIEIIVFGKWIKTIYPKWISHNVKPEVRNRIFGYFFADPLAKYLSTTKQDFKKNTFVFKVISKMEDELYKWLDDEGYIVKSTPSESSFVRNALTETLQKILNMKEFSMFNPWLSYSQSSALMPDQSGNVIATPANGTQETSGTSGGTSHGDGVNILGDDPGQALAEDEKGTEKASENKRRISSFGMIVEEFPQDPREGWIDTVAKAVVINKAHRMYKAIEPIGSNLLTLNILRVAVSAFIAYKIPQIPDPDLTAEKVLEYQSKMITEVWTRLGEK